MNHTEQPHTAEVEATHQEVETTAQGLTPATSPAPAVDATPADQINGRSAFCVETTGGGLAVQTVFIGEDGRVVPMPALFPDVHYALEQIEGLRRLVTERFAQAAQVGAQVIAAHQARAAASLQPGQTRTAEPTNGHAPQAEDTAA